MEFIVGSTLRKVSSKSMFFVAKSLIGLVGLLQSRMAILTNSRSFLLLSSVNNTLNFLLSFVRSNSNVSFSNELDFFSSHFIE